MEEPKANWHCWDDMPKEHDNEQITYVLEGALHFWLGADGAEEVTVRAGEVLVIPPNLPHQAEALEDTLDVDIFSPPRQDWLDKTDDYLRRGSPDEPRPWRTGRACRGFE